MMDTYGKMQQILDICADLPQIANTDPDHAKELEEELYPVVRLGWKTLSTEDRLYLFRHFKYVLRDIIELDEKEIFVYNTMEL